MGEEYLFLIMNELLHFEKLLIFSEKNFLLCFLLFCFLIWDFLFYSWSTFYTLSAETFVRELWPKFVLLKKLIFPYSHFFSIRRVSTFKVYAEAKGFTDYSFIIVAEIYIIFRSELIQQMNSGPYSLGTDGSNDESGIKKLNPVLIRLFDDNKRNAKRVPLRHFLITSIPF